MVIALPLQVTWAQLQCPGWTLCSIDVLNNPQPVRAKWVLNIGQSTHGILDLQAPALKVGEKNAVDEKHRGVDGRVTAVERDIRLYRHRSCQ